MKTTSLFIVATVGNRDKVKAEEPIEGLNYALLIDHDDVIVTCHCKLNEIIINDEESQI